jgi:hypothetical protein
MTFPRVRLLTEGTRTGILRSLLPGGPRLLGHKSDGTTSIQAPFRRGNGGKPSLPDAAPLPLGTRP